MDINPDYLRHLKAEFLPGYEIAIKAKEFISKYYPEYDFKIDPVVPIDEILDIRLKINLAPWPGLQSKSKYGIDGILTYDEDSSRCTIYYDSQYNTPGVSNVRFRFTLAHETGHWYLHDYIYKAIRAKNIEDFIQKYLILSESKNDIVKWLDIQANTFASFVLIPPNALKFIFLKCIQNNKEIIEIKIDSEQSEQLQKNNVVDYLSEEIANIFEVSKAAAISAIRRDDLMDTYWQEMIDGF